jgi:hypothetical protein
LTKNDQRKKWIDLGYAGTPGVTALELIKRAYESNTLDKLRDFLNIEPQMLTG